MSNSIIPSQTATSDSDQSPFDSIRQVRDDGSEFWSARDLMPLLGYSRWENFETPLHRAMATASNQGHDVATLFLRSQENSGGRPRLNYALSRFAAYLVAMNGDPNMEQVAAAQAYFAIRTREAEVRDAPQELTGAPLMAKALIEAQAVLEATTAENQQLKQQAELDAQKVNYVDEFVYEDDDLRSLRTLAAELGVGEQWLRGLLLLKKWIYSEKHTRRRSKGGSETRFRYSAYADKKRYFQIRVCHEAPLFKGELMHTLKITPPGAEAISRLVKKEIGA